MAKSILSNSIRALTGLSALYAPAGIQQSLSQAGSDVVGDFDYLIDNAQFGLADIVPSPLHITRRNRGFCKPEFDLALGGVGAVWGGALALDQTMQSQLTRRLFADLPGKLAAPPSPTG